ncbi:helix-turn-helix transcriptional regulator [Thalassorhabdomicrobium marinisediminis]|uniref:helix-turn-helix transcriptional regulator n=1 Tax=Thalassorhabdomicrobium marinisediminis TaxID=2170577 RepID=UPI00249131F3|nr:LuxR C-terminal-related transcriptional regulator [Thalassorhabdomicrobium marinisediminis]
MQKDREKAPNDLPHSFATDAMTRLSPLHRHMLGRLLNAADGIRDATLTDDERAALLWLNPFVCRNADRWIIPSDQIADFARAAMPELGTSGDAATPILLALEKGEPTVALHHLQASGGAFFMHLHGLQPALDVLDRFEGTQRPDVVALDFLVAVKLGDVSRAERILGLAAGAALVNLGQPLQTPEKYPPQYLFARFMLATYRSEPPRQFLLDEAAQLLARTGPRQHLLRGAIYNALLEPHIRQGRLAEAEDCAVRALHHYGAAKAPYLSFFVHVHRAMMDLTTGNPREATEYLAAAERSLAETAFETVQEERFLALLRASVAYETGEPQAMVDFVETEFSQFAFGELWPSIAALALAHGADALLQLRGQRAAMEFVDRWRLQLWRSRRFQLLIEQRDVAVRQGAQRWRDARARLEGMATRIGRLWMDTAGDNLADLQDVEDIVQALLWLRQQAFETPRDTDLPARLAALEANPRLALRQRVCLQLWRVWVDRRQGRIAPARQGLARTLGLCAKHQCNAPVLEERVFLLPLLEDPQIMRGEMEQVTIPRNLRGGSVAAFGTGPLSRQEWRALLLLAEGCSNKEIAREMVVSLPTVKFHLKNLFRKLAVSDRNGAVSAARNSGLI